MDPASDKMAPENRTGDARRALHRALCITVTTAAGPPTPPANPSPPRTAHPVAARLQPHPGQRRRRDPRHRPDVALDHPEALDPPSQASRAATTSSPERPMKFHHMTTSSPNGSPPSTSTRAPSAPAVTDTPPGCRAAPTTPSSPRATARSPSVTDPASTSTDTSKPSGTGSTTDAPAGEHHLGPHQRRLDPHRRRRPPQRPHEHLRPNPVRRPPPPRARGARSAARRRPPPTAAPPTAAPRAARWSPGVDTSECEMPRPAVIRFTSPGRTSATVPSESRCSTSPLNNHDTVASPQCGCGATSIPRWPTRRRARSGRRSTRPRRTSAPGPAGCGERSWTADPRAAPHGAR